MKSFILNNSIPLISCITTLIGAFMGAWFAFKLQDRKDDKLNNKLKKVALNRALFIIYRQYNDLLNIQRTIHDYRDNPIKAFVMPANIAYKSNIKINDEDLSFILDTNQPEILSQIFLEHAKYTQALIASEMRTQLHVNQIQPALEKFGLHNRNVSLIELEENLGKRLYVSAIKITEELFYQVDNTIISHKNFETDLIHFSKHLFPHEEFIRFH